MHGQSYDFCRGEHPNASSRDSYLAGLASQKRANGRGAIGGPCVHLGPPTGATRDCPTCQGTVRQKLYGCAIYGECVLKDCRTCKDHWAAPEEPGGLGVAHHADDHYALTFSKSADMALYSAEGEVDRSWAGKWQGETAFFLGGGPSLAAVDLAPLRDRLTIAVNGVCEVFPEPSIWLGVDDPETFRSVPWGRPETLKLLPRGWASSELADGMPISECPGVRYFLRNGCFSPWRFLSERTVNWGSESPWGSGRSVMLAALKLLWYFGVRRVVLLGCDFHMTPEKPYAHSATKDERGCASNNDKFRILDGRLGMLRPTLEAAGMVIVNATAGSRLGAFERVRLVDELGDLQS